MDVHGTRFHLLAGAADWTAQLHASPLEAGVGPAVWNDASAAVMLERFPLRLPARPGPTVATPAARRAAACDRYGNRFWIGRDEASLWWLPAGGSRASLWWDGRSERPAPAAGAFGAAAEADPPLRLAGLAVSVHHQLVCADRAQQRLLVFDLWGGGAPLSFRWPAALTPFEAFAIAAAADGGVWLLDAVHGRLVHADRQFGWGLPAATGTARVFHAPGQPPLQDRTTRLDAPIVLPSPDAVALLMLADDSLLVMTAPPGRAGRLLQLRDGQLLADLALVVRVLVGDTEELLDLVPETAALAGDGERTTVIVAQAGGRQAFAFDLVFEGERLVSAQPRPDHLPLHAWGGRALMALSAGVAYDVAAGGDTGDTSTVWAPLTAVERPQFARANAMFVQAPLDGRQPGCVWHRLLLDGCIPPETSVSVHSRAADDPELLDTLPWLEEPGLALRSGGTELPWYDPWPQRRRPLPAGTGSWELLFENARGRWLQVLLTLRGNGRSSPCLQHLRAWYPRFSYPEHFLPAVYREEAAAGAFLERLLANPEGINTEIEGRIAGVSTLFDARSAPPEALDWLGSWLGIALDPLWPTLHRSDSATTPDRRRLLIRFATRLYERRGTADGLLFSLHLLLEPCLESLLARLQRASVHEDAALRGRLDALGLPYPASGAGDAALEDLLYDWAVSPKRPSRLRIVEHFRTRGGRRAAAGDASLPADAAPIGSSLAHRFSVLLPAELAPDLAAMAERIVRLEMPAHTGFDLRRFWDFFRVGAARLGIDTVLGEGGRFTPLVLDRDALAQAYVPPRHPFDIPERFVPGRDRLGSAAPL